VEIFQPHRTKRPRDNSSSSSSNNLPTTCHGLVIIREVSALNQRGTNINHSKVEVGVEEEEGATSITNTPRWNAPRAPEAEVIVVGEAAVVRTGNQWPRLRPNLDPKQIPTTWTVDLGWRSEKRRCRSTKRSTRLRMKSERSRKLKISVRDARAKWKP